MPTSIISKRTRNEFREYFSNMMVLRTIEMEFEAANIHIDEEYEPNFPGVRRCMVEQYYHSINWELWRDVQKIVVCFESVLISLEDDCESDSSSKKEFAKPYYSKLKKTLERDGFSFVNSRLTRVGGIRLLMKYQAKYPK